MFRTVLRAVFRSATELQDLLPVLKAHCDADEYRVYAVAIASVIAESGQQIINRVMAEHPELEAEVDSAVSKDGRY